MLEKIAQFEKVSLDEFKKDSGHLDLDIDEVYKDIILPLRATKGSAGYDFYAPFDIEIKPNEAFLVPSGIRAKINDGWVLMIFPRSGLGFKYQLELSNTVGIIDSDYYNSSNEGHIMIKLVNRSVEGKVIKIEKGKAFAQGIFTCFGITEDDAVTDLRDGGFGSTDKKGDQ